MIRLNTQSLQLPVQEPNFANNIAIFNRAITRALEQIENECNKIEFELFDVVVILRGNVTHIPPPFNKVEFDIFPEDTPDDIIEQIQNILRRVFGAFSTDL